MTKAPSRVDRYEYWVEPPPEPSPRLAYWLDRIVDEGWRPNRRVGMMGYDERAEFYGVYMWESLNVLYPATNGSCLNLSPSGLRVWLDTHGLRSDWVPTTVTIPAFKIHGQGATGWVEVPEDDARA